MGRVIFDAGTIMALHDLSAYDLAKEAELLGISRATAYGVASGKVNPSFKSLSILIQALNNLTGKELNVGDVIRYVKDDDETSQMTG
ncbi:helix-turn-helix domain-containing protein [Deinococcus caeni]|uniref:HTH cro/C1-type domain-containing protein n=1 Tax=Deinococcus caeni TaxID=569127 RepID=A0ABP9UHF6_9DEIO